VVVSLDGLLDEPDGLLEDPDGLLDEPDPALEESLDEPELEDDGEDGAGVADGDLLVLLEPDMEPEPDGEDGVVAELPLVLPLPEPVVRSPAPRSQAAIRLAPRARETATARV